MKTIALIIGFLIIGGALSFALCYLRSRFIRVENARAIVGDGFGISPPEIRRTLMALNSFCCTFAFIASGIIMLIR